MGYKNSNSGSSSERKQGDPHPQWPGNYEQWNRFLKSYDVSKDIRLKVMMVEDVAAGVQIAFYRDWKEGLMNQCLFCRSLSFHVTQEEFQEAFRIEKEIMEARNLIWFKR